MFSVFHIFDLSTTDLVLLSLCGILIGMAKAGVSGTGLMVVPMMAAIFGGRESVGIVLPLLIFADIFAVNYYHRHANWHHVLKLMPWALLGVIFGAVFGKYIDDKQFKQTIAILVIIGIALMLWQDFRKNKTSVPQHWLFAASLGMAGGFTSMVGNAAGPIFTLYLLSIRFPKNKFIGTGAWFYFLMNCFKLPFQIFYWKKIDIHTFTLDLYVFPLIIAGVFLGIYIVRFIPEKAYRIFIISTTLIAAIFLF